MYCGPLMEFSLKSLTEESFSPWYSRISTLSSWMVCCSKHPVNSVVRRIAMLMSMNVSDDVFFIVFLYFFQPLTIVNI